MEVGDQLFKRFLAGGFEQLTDTEPTELADYLEDRAAAGGGAALLFLAEAVRAVYVLFRDHNEYGGVRIGFVRQLDDLVRERLPSVVRCEPSWAAELARELRDQVWRLVHDYDSRETYE